MAERLVNVDRQTPMLLPPDLREWVADNELAHLILEAVELCDMSGARLNVRGSGSEQYPPSMMMALLIYAYATGLFSSRRIERATYESVALRYLCANHHPDHDTIAKFRRENEALFRSCFGQVLLLAREAGVLHEQRKEKLLAAKGVIEARRQAARESGRRDQPGSGHRTQSASITEPETRRLRRGSGSPVQGYNAQALIDAGRSGLIVGAHLSDAPNDAHQLQAGVEALAPEAGQPVAVLVDKGYDNTEQIARVQADKGLLVLCRPQRRPNALLVNANRHGHRHWKWQQRRLMEQRFLCPLLQRLYQRRHASAEGAFARIKSHLGFRRFQVWGKSAATTEWMLVCLAHNCRILARAKS